MQYEKPKVEARQAIKALMVIKVSPGPDRAEP
jgi:hypothetical protein